MYRRLPSTFYALVAMDFLVQPALFIANGQRLDPRASALCFLALLLYGIARGSWLAWGFLSAYTVLLTLAGLLSVGTGLSARLLVVNIYNLVTVALLLSPSVRAHLKGPTAGSRAATVV